MVGVIDLDDQGRVCFANAAARRWLVREDLASGFAELLSTESRQVFCEELFPRLLSGELVEEAELVLLDAEGRDFPALCNGDGLRLVFMPIRRRAQREQRMKEAQARLMLQDRLTMMGTLAAGVAHELNNPLAYVVGNLGFLSDAQLDEEEREGLEDVREGVGRIQGIVNSLKVLSRTEEQRKVPIDLNEMGKVACQLTSRDVFGCCRLEVFWSEQPLVVLGDEGKLTQVMLNLMLNACQAFPVPDVERNRILVRSWVSGLEACVEVDDNGPGIPRELQGRIFDPFFTTKPVGSGTGLGLSICQGIVQSLGGRLELMPSELGACFRVTLPVAPPSRPPRAVRGGTEKLEGLRCLIIDDDEKVAKVLQRLLCKCDCKVALGGMKGLECLSEGDYDLVVCDLMMPDLSGIEVYQRALGQRERFLFVTGGAFTTEVENFLKEVAAPVLTKPFDQEKLVAAYRSLVA